MSYGHTPSDSREWQELTFVEQVMCQVLVSALCMYYISSYNLMGQGVSPFYRRGKCLTGTSPVVGSRRQDGESCQRGWWLVFAGLRSFIGIYFEPLQTVLAWPFFLGHRGWAGVWSGPDGEQHSTAFDPGIYDPWLLRGSQDLENSLCLLCPPRPQEGSTDSLCPPCGCFLRTWPRYTTSPDSRPLFFFKQVFSNAPSPSWSETIC